eukprot:1682333-Rhodomonas_salina.1
MGIDNLLNGMDAASKVEYSSQRRTPVDTKENLQPSEPLYIARNEPSVPTYFAPAQTLAVNASARPAQAASSGVMAVAQQVCREFKLDRTKTWTVHAMLFTHKQRR